MYEYGTGQQGLNYPNPYKVENTILEIRAALFLITALGLLVLGKWDLDAGNFKGLILNLVVAMAFLSGAISTGYKISRQLKVYFGRGQPKSLAPDISADLEGVTEQGLHLKETIRQGALNVVPPGGNLNGFLYQHFKYLIIAPPEVQILTQRAFGNLIKFSIILALFLLSSFFAYGSNIGSWLGIYFLGLTSFILIKPLLNDRIDVEDLSIKTFWKLFISALLVPIGLVIGGKNLPDIHHYYLGWQSLGLLIIAIAGELLLLKALYEQLETPTGITTAFEQEAITFNAPPNQLIFEIERKLQEQWISSIPNRIYSRLMPKIAVGRTGDFKGQVIQESQPMAPKALEDGQTLEYILSDKRKRKLFEINVISLIFNFISTCGIVSIFLGVHNNFSQGIYNICWLPLLSGLMLLGIYWTKVIHSLWGRFDFESKLYIFDLEGNFTTAEVNYGNYMRDTFQTRKDIVNIESMTLRVWVTHLRTAVFGHGIDSENRPRRIISMTGLKDESKHWLEIIKSFAQGQSMLIAPTSQEDVKRANALAQLNALGSTLNEEHKKNIMREAHDQIKNMFNVPPPPEITNKDQ